MAPINDSNAVIQKESAAEMILYQSDIANWTHPNIQSEVFEKKKEIGKERR